MGILMSFLIGVISSIAAKYLIRFGIERHSSRLSFNRVLENITILYKKIQNDNYLPDYIIAIDRNGCIVGAILAGYLGLKTVIAAATENIRKPDGTRDSKLSEAYKPREEVFRGKKLLMIIAFNDTGTSLETVYNCYSSLLNKPAEIRTAALYTTVSPKIKPKYYAKEVGRDIKVSINLITYKMPWMKKEWKYWFGDERVPYRR